MADPVFDGYLVQQLREEVQMMMMELYDPVARQSIVPKDAGGVLGRFDMPPATSAHMAAVRPHQNITAITAITTPPPPSPPPSPPPPPTAHA